MDSSPAAVNAARLASHCTAHVAGAAPAHLPPKVTLKYSRRNYLDYGHEWNVSCSFPISWSC